MHSVQKRLETLNRNHENQCAEKTLFILVMQHIKIIDRNIKGIRNRLLCIAQLIFGHIEMVKRPLFLKVTTTDS